MGKHTDTKVTVIEEVFYTHTYLKTGAWHAMQGPIGSAKISQVAEERGGDKGKCLYCGFIVGKARQGKQI